MAKIKALKSEFQKSLDAATKKSQAVQTQFNKFKHIVFSFPIESSIKNEFMKNY